jgi:sodium/bile acid cotransporter 7
VLRRVKVDPFLVLILLTVGVAALLPARGAVATGFSHATTVAIALLFFLYGARLSTREAIDGLRHWRLHGTVVLATFVLFPLLGLAIQLVPASVLPTELKLGVLFLCCLPSTVQSSIAFTSVARGNVPAAICAASLSNLLGIVITPLLTGLLLSSQGGISGGAVLDVALQLLAPFVLGQLLRRWIGDWVTRNKRYLQVVDRGSILLVVYVAFSEGMVQGIWSRLSLGALAALLVTCVVLLAVVLGHDPVLRLEEEPGLRVADGRCAVRGRAGRAAGAAPDALPPDPADGLRGDRGSAGSAGGRPRGRARLSQG